MIATILDRLQIPDRKTDRCCKDDECCTLARRVDRHHPDGSRIVHHASQMLH